MGLPHFICGRLAAATLWLRGCPPPRGGERREPNPTFLAHAAALTGFYVALTTKLPSDVVLVSFAREGDAREQFQVRDGRRRAIAPDARIELEDDDGRRLVGLLEVDLVTMSHRRLRAKAGGYADYSRVRAWRERHDFCPALLFATVAEPRALAFLDVLAGELDDHAELFACACGLAREPGRAVVEATWQTAGNGEPLDLVAALREDRRPYDEENARWEDARRREREERERLLRNPAALRDHLRRQRPSIPERLDPAGTAIELLLEGEGELAEPERRALSALGRMLAEPLLARWAAREPGPEEREALADLVEHCRSRQLEQVATLADRLGAGPALRRARRRLEVGGLLSAGDLGWLPRDAERDRKRAPGRRDFGPPTRSAAKPRRAASPRPRVSPAGFVAVPPSSSTRSTAGCCASVRAARRSPTPRRTRGWRGASPAPPPVSATSAGRATLSPSRGAGEPRSQASASAGQGPGARAATSRPRGATRNG